MPTRSAGLVVFRGQADALEVILVHPGGPFYARRDEGVWSVPKGLYDPDEAALDAARREFTEETSIPAPEGAVIELGDVAQKGGKVVTAFAVRGDLDLTHAVSNEFEMEWPRGSGRMRSFPEVDRIEWFDLDTARTKLLPAQLPFLDRLHAALS
ncbi:NUDIX domain-containing protein [Williamsia sp. CHRR-6]|uniref:NUDIX domain-containing protein n=1 Tax=Williamsia sp. CHRR-6 TaxID=2835871 RepID=UPI001BDAB8A0|nr:NUDIX domain-containing protein [Williamsia sp. CHRR-6]MBT0566634.1 NUDIX domain-containing protein [Williamsia sp. CHRR-6]